MTEEMVLVQKAKDFDSDAWAEIYHRFYHRIYLYCCRNLGDADEAEDMTASVFLAATERIGSFAYKGIPFSAWLYRIAHNMVVDHYRKTRTPALPLCDELVPGEDGTAEAAERKQEMKRLSAAMRELTDDQRQVIALKFLDGLSNAEVAQVVNKPEGAVKSLQHRGLTSLRRILGGGAT